MIVRHPQEELLYHEAVAARAAGGFELNDVVAVRTYLLLERYKLANQSRIQGKTPFAIVEEAQLDWYAYLEGQQLQSQVEYLFGATEAEVRQKGAEGVVAHFARGYAGLKRRV